MASIHVQPHKRLTPAEREKLGEHLVKEYGTGASLATLAARHRTSAGRVRLLLLERGVALRPRGGDMRSDRARRGPAPEGGPGT